VNYHKLVLVLVGLLPQLIFAQTLTQNIRGKVMDATTQQPLVGASIVVSNTTQGTLTNEKGQFVITQVPIGRQQLKATFVGYETTVTPFFELSTGKEVEIIITLRTTTLATDSLTIYAPRNYGLPAHDLIYVSGQEFMVEETKRFAGSFYDPSRMAQSFAGVMAQGDENELIVRGNSPRGLMWRIEGVEVPNLNHLVNGEGSSGGGVSILSNNILANSRFLTGAFPAEYGNATAGVFDIRLKAGNSYQHEHTIQAGILGLDFASEGPIGQKGKSSYVANYRYATLDLLQKIGLNIGGSVIPQYQDFTFKLNLPTQKAGTFSVFGIAGTSKASDLADFETDDTDEKNNPYSDIEQHWLGIVGISHEYHLSPKTRWRTVLMSSATQDQFLRDSVTENLQKFRLQQQRFNYYTQRISTQIQHQLNAKNNIQFGVIASNLGYDLSVQRSNIAFLPIAADLQSTGFTQYYQAYTQYQHYFTEKLSATAGVHYSLFALNTHQTVEPRAGLRYQFKRNQSLSLGYGWHSRLEPISLYMANVVQTDGSLSNSNKNLRPTQSQQYVLGYEWRNENWRYRTEVYYQHLFLVPIENRVGSTFSLLNVNNGFTNLQLNNNGKGKNIGVEFTLERYFKNSWYAMATLSLFDSRYVAADGTWRDTRFNARYITNWLAGKEWKVGKERNNILSANIRLIARGGNRITPADLAASEIAGQLILQEQRAFEQAGFIYFRPDFAITYRKNKAKRAWSISLDIQNIANFTNYDGYTYIAARNELRKKQMLGIIPLIFYRLEL
jgi:hypothetical protein